MCVKRKDMKEKILFLIINDISNRHKGDIIKCFTVECQAVISILQNGRFG